MMFPPPSVTLAWRVVLPPMRTLLVAGDTVMVPIPTSNEAVAERLEVMVTVQLLVVPVHAPDQPLNVESLFGTAVSVTTVPFANVGPTGLVVTDPEPLPEIAMDSV
jgi:hypothetical protein